MNASESTSVKDQSSSPIVELQGVVKTFGRQQVLRGLDLKVPRGKITFVIGRSGEGKSVTLKHIVGILLPDQGEVVIDGESMDKATLMTWKRVRRSIGILFQDGALFDGFSVGENVAFPLREFERLTARQLSDRVNELLTLVGMPGTAARMPADLSIGEKKRVGLARALSLNPKIILYDEPTTSMDPLISELIDDLIVSMQTQISGLSSVVISHDMRSILRVAQHVSMIHEGRIYFDGSADQLRRSSDPLLQQFVTGGLHGPLSKPIS